MLAVSRCRWSSDLLVVEPGFPGSFFLQKGDFGMGKGGGYYDPPPCVQ